MKNTLSRGWMCLSVFALLSLAATARANISNVSASLSVSTVNTPAQYTLGFTTGSAGALTTSDTIVAVLTANTAVPASFPGGASAQITVNGNTASATGAGQTLTIAVPAPIGASTAVTVVITTGSANLVNPSIPASYTVTMRTSVEGIPVLSNTYSITASSTPLQINSVAVTPNTVGNQSQVTTGITLGSAGALWGGNSQIVFIFPVDTLVTNGAFGGVLVAGAASLATGNTGARTITTTPALHQANGNSFNIVIPTSAHRNPTTTGSAYTLTVDTSAQPPGTSPNYSIGISASTVNVDIVIPNPTTIGNQAQYNVQFDLSSDGALVGGVSQIIITFPSDTIVSSGALAGVTVEGVGASSATGNSGARQVTVVPSQNFGGGTVNITVVIPLTYLRNPSATGNFTLTVSTSVQPAGTSPIYAIGLSSTSVSVTSVTPNPATLGNNSQYTIDFDTSADGALLSGTSQIIITFPADTAVTNGAIGGVLVDGAAAFSATGNSGARTVTITVPLNIAGSTSVSVFIPPAALRNPTIATNYTLDVATSVQPVGTSPTYPIGQSGTSVVITSVVPSPNYISQSAVYTIDFNTSGDGALIGGTSQITVSFSVDTAITNGALSGVTVNGIAVTTATGNSASRLITLDLAQNISGNTTGITISLPNTAVRNPSTPGSYTLTVATSVQPAGLSPSFDISLVPTPTITPTITPTVQLLPDNTAFTYPSPAKGDTLWFYYSVRGPAEVRIEIYNVIGEKGKVITNSHMSSGNQRTSWDIKDVAPGLYFYRLYIEDAAGKRDLGLKKLYIIK